MAESNKANTESEPIKESNTLRRVLMPLISLSLFCLASAAIYEILKDTSYDQFAKELASLSDQQVMLAALCAIASFIVLIGYDWSALAYLSRQLPLRTVALGTFCGCAIANTVGLNLISGSSVRYRIYVPAGLDGIDVARVTLFGMIAFGIGTSVVAAAALAIHPELVAGYFRLPSEFLFRLGIGSLVVFGLLIVVTCVRTQPVRIGPWTLLLPSGKITLGQLAISVVDIIFAGGCLYVLLPEASVPFVGFLIIYTVGIVAGMASNVPGGLGVFEGIMLFAFRHSIPAESLAAALLVYRGIYYVAPLIAATFILALKELSEHLYYPKNGN